MTVTLDPLWCWTPPSEDNYPSHMTCSVRAITVPSWGYLSVNTSWGLTYKVVITENHAGLRWSGEGGWWGRSQSDETAVSAQLSTTDRFHHHVGFKDCSWAVTDIQTRRVTCNLRFHRRPGERLWRRGGTRAVPAGPVWSTDPSLFHSLSFPHSQLLTARLCDSCFLGGLRALTSR